jgi:hypothetical protein
LKERNYLTANEQWNQREGTRRDELGHFSSRISSHMSVCSKPQRYIHTHAHTYIHTYIRTHTYAHAHAYIHTHMHIHASRIYINSCAYTYTHADTHADTQYTRAHSHTYICTCTYTYIHTRAHTHTYIHTCTYTYMYTGNGPGLAWAELNWTNYSLKASSVWYKEFQFWFGFHFLRFRLVSARFGLRMS